MHLTLHLHAKSSGVRRDSALSELMLQADGLEARSDIKSPGGTMDTEGSTQTIVSAFEAASKVERKWPVQH